jgi:hypothetical protein
MSGLEKSDSPIVAGKPANEAAQAAEEPVERRGVLIPGEAAHHNEMMPPAVTE